MNATEIIQNLQLEPHIEGGFFRRTYAEKNSMMSSIYYLLSKDSPIGYFHKNKSDIIHYFHDGDPIRYYVITEEGELTTHLLGKDLTEGESFQLLVKGGSWKASLLLGDHYALISEAVTPEFKYEDQELASPTLFEKHFPQHYNHLKHFIFKNFE